MAGAERAGDGRVGRDCCAWSALLLVGLVAAGVRVPGTALARAIASRILCAASLADGCGDEPALIAAYGTEVGKLVREHMPTTRLRGGLAGGAGRLPALPQHRAAATARRGAWSTGPMRDLPVTAFVHVVDCRAGEAEQPEPRADCSGPRAGNLYIQYWTYYADSATLRGVPIVGDEGYHHDDWEAVADPHRARRRGRRARLLPQRLQLRAGASPTGAPTPASTRSRTSPKRSAPAPTTAGARRPACCSSPAAATPATPTASRDVDRFTPGRRVHLIPLEPIAADATPPTFAISPPWRKKVWRDPEARDRLSTRCWLGRAPRATSAASAGRRRGGSSRR